MITANTFWVLAACKALCLVFYRECLIFSLLQGSMGSKYQSPCSKHCHYIRLFQSGMWAEALTWWLWTEGKRSSKCKTTFHKMAVRHHSLICPTHLLDWLPSRVGQSSSALTEIMSAPEIIELILAHRDLGQHHKPKGENWFSGDK